MIVYNVKRRWFPMKNDAEAYRKQEGLPKEALFKLNITDRDQLAALLNGLCNEEPAQEPPAPVEVVDRNKVLEVPDYVPKFLAVAEAKRQGKEISWVSSDASNREP